MESHPVQHGSAAFVGTPCRWRGCCSNLWRRCCLFGHTCEEVTASSLVGRHLPSSDEFDQLRTAVRSVAASLTWSRGISQVQVVEKTVEILELLQAVDTQSRQHSGRSSRKIAKTRDTWMFQVEDGSGTSDTRFANNDAYRATRPSIFGKPVLLTMPSIVIGMGQQGLQFVDVFFE